MKKCNLSKIEKNEIIKILEKEYPGAKAELNFSNEFELLIATILSAQCTDIRVNKVTKELFRTLKNPVDYVNMGAFEIKKIINSCGLSKTKSENIVKTCEMIIKDYDGKVPNLIEKLMKLPGVGKKTANVVASNAFGIPAIAVDTHVFRVSNRIGLVKCKNVKDTENELMKIIPKEKWTKMHHVLIFHGRRCCTARNPNCDFCAVRDKCIFNCEV